VSFAPGQYLTAQRLNRLQSKTYWTQNSANQVAGSYDPIPGTNTSITIETDGATVAFDWTAAVYGTTTAMASLTSVQAVWDVNTAPTFAVALFSNSTERVTAAANWMTTIPTAGTYTFKLKATVATNSTLQIYTTMKVVVTEVA